VRDQEFADSLLEGTRFELSVPRPRLPRVGAPCPRLRFLPRQRAFSRRNIMFNLPTFSSSRPLTIFGLVPFGSERSSVFMVCSSEIRRLGQAISGHGRDITHRGVGLKLSLPGGNSGPETGGKPFYRAGGLHGLRGAVCGAARLLLRAGGNIRRYTARGKAL